MSKYIPFFRAQGEDNSPRRVGAVRRGRWQDFLETLGVREQDLPRNGSRHYRCLIGDKPVRIYAEFGPAVVYVSADSMRGEVRRAVYDANSTRAM